MSLSDYLNVNFEIEEIEFTPDRCVTSVKYERWMELAHIASQKIADCSGPINIDEQLILIRFVFGIAAQLEEQQTTIDNVMMERIHEIAVESGWVPIDGESVEEMLADSSIDVFFNRFAYRIAFELQGTIGTIGTTGPAV